MTENQKQSGQCLVEWILSLVLLLPMLWGGSWLFSTAWKQAQCVHEVFEATHETLTGQRPVHGYATKIENTPHLVVGRKLCGRSWEKVGLRKLEFLKKWE